MRLHDYAPRPAHLKWLLDSDPAIRWQVMRDLTGEAPNAIAAERSRVATEGWEPQFPPLHLLLATGAGAPPGGGAVLPKRAPAFLITSTLSTALKDSGSNPPAKPL